LYKEVENNRKKTNFGKNLWKVDDVKIKAEPSIEI
jgi:hypothetical protein